MWLGKKIAHSDSVILNTGPVSDRCASDVLVDAYIEIDPEHASDRW